MTFTYWGEELAYCTAPYNRARENERAVEVPIAERFVDQAQGDGLEVGNVLAHYRPISHPVVDRYEHAPGVANLDVFECEHPADWIVAISTLEHVRWDEEPREEGGSVRALRHLLDLLQPGGRMLVTVPFGWNAPLDAAILSGLPTERECSFVRSGDGWMQTDQLAPKPYGLTTPWAESVWVGEFRA